VIIFSGNDKDGESSKEGTLGSLNIHFRTLGTKSESLNIAGDRSLIILICLVDLG
jgi:hypothetical protein